jgi:predicted nucleic acid-binding protein
LREELRNYVLAPFSEAVCLRWAQVMDNAQRTGRPISVGDAWIAATALAYAVPLITNNRDDFAGVTGLTIISEQTP